MVQSRIKPEIVYNESRTIDYEDMDYSAPLYETEILEKRIVIGIGKPKYTYTGKGVVYYPAYLISKDVVRGKIGLFEVDTKNLSKYADEIDFDVEKYVNDENTLLLYPFVNRNFLDMSESDPEYYKKQVADEEPVINPVALEKESSVFDLVQKDNPKIKEIEKKESKEIFEDIGNADIPELLKEETKAEADKLKTDTANSNWMQKFMKNEHYRIHKIPGDGDCFFTVVMEAFRQIGKKTTIEKLREIVADSVVQETFDQYLMLFNMFKTEIEVNKSNINKITEKIKEHKKRFEKAKEKSEKDMILKTIELMNEDKKEFKKKLTTAERDIGQYRFMEGVVSLEDFRNAMKKSSYWADETAIVAIEKKLNIKMIILSEENYKSGSEDTVMTCATGTEDYEIPNPEYYIMTSYSGDHYQLISYKDKKILKFSEIPYYVKTLIANKCVEHNAGVFHHITDFRRFQEKFGIDPVATAYSSEPPVPSQLYDDTIHFMFYNSSADAKPGKGSGEKIKKQDIVEFVDLQHISGWRRMLDDDFASPFSIDGKQWQTVEHYYQASKFKKGFPDFYASFSLDSNSEISVDVKKAKGAGGVSGKYEKVLLRPKNVKLDPDFYGGRDRAERKNALIAKFENPELRKVLRETKKAKLLHFVRGREPEVDMLLMEVRETI